MMYRTKLLIFSMALVAITCVLVLSVDFRGDRHLVLKQMQQQVKLIAADAAARVHGALNLATNDAVQLIPAP